MRQIVFRVSRLAHESGHCGQASDPDKAEDGILTEQPPVRRSALRAYLVPVGPARPNAWVLHVQGHASKLAQAWTQLVWEKRYSRPISAMRLAWVEGTLQLYCVGLIWICIIAADRAVAW